MNPFENYKPLDAQLFKLSETQILPGILLEDVRMSDNIIGMTKDQMVMTLHAKVLGKQLPAFSITKSNFVSQPKNPWQMFKDMYRDKWWMRRLVNRWPVKAKVMRIEMIAEWKQWASYPWQGLVHSSKDLQAVRVIEEPKVKWNSDDYK